ncbi:MAG: PilC/PilY family type IV pilus protein [Ottowia sp.]|nr:PilC/PilY family type IV pilus protein [Ottowia sp.]
MKLLSTHKKLKTAIGTTCLAAGLLLASAMSSAQMLQQPLEAGGGGVPPNLVFTLDDSGSMWWECVPDDLCLHPGTSRGIASIPGMERVTKASGNFAGIVMYDDGADGPVYSSNGTIVYDPRDGYVSPYPIDPLLPKQLRSNAINPTYYDPQVHYLPWLKADGSRFPDAPPSAAPILPGSTQTQNLEGNQTIEATWYRRHANRTDGTQAAHIARYYILKPGTTGSDKDDFILVKITNDKNYPKGPNREDCLGSSCTYQEEIQNFANWYTYYRTRALTAIAGTAEAFADVPETYRVGYGRINQTTNKNIDGVNARTLERGVRGFSEAKREEFYDWLFDQTQPSGGTPLRRAMDDVGRYFSRTDNRGPWGANPGTNDSTPHSSCRRSIHMLMTDGMWNGDAASTSAARQNVDNSSGDKITGPSGQEYKYVPVAPYKDGASNTLADVAMYYWNRDLRPDLENNITAIPGNPAFWQHMVNFTIAFGVDGTLDNPGDFEALKKGSKSWPNPGSSGGDARTIDDLWHAAINSRGRALSARNSAEYSAAITSILDEIKAMEGSEAGIGVSTSVLGEGDDAKMYSASFSSPAWIGDVKAEMIDEEGKLADDQSGSWTASENLPAPGARKIFTYNPMATADKGVEFQWSSLSDEMKELLWGSTSGGEPLVAYLRGDSTGEGTEHRAREKQLEDGSIVKNPLGDIVHSTPTLIHQMVDSFYTYLPSKTGDLDQGWGAESYERFFRAKKLREPQLAVGANDGMLHLFNDNTGVESFAYIPHSVLGSVQQLWNTDYTHRYFVDGPVQESDVYDLTNNRWHNLIQGFGGAGGKYLYTIRMPVPDWDPDGDEPNALGAAESAPSASDILWEISNETSGFAEMGYVITKPETGVLPDGTWVTIFGNGYESPSGKAQLFIVNALTGALIKKIDTGVGSVEIENGLGGVGVVRDSQQRIVAAYAGDLRGNLWKFDLSSESESDWDVAFGGNPLFVANNSDSELEPITAKPSFRAFPTGGVMVLFGTGRLFSVGDQANTEERSMYGLWDQVPIGTGPGTASDIINDSDTLVTQTINTTPLADGEGVYRQLIETPVDYKTKRGWRLPLTIAAGERVIDDPQPIFDRILMQTITLTNIEDECQSAATLRRAYVLDPFMSGTKQAPFDGNSDTIMESHIVDLTSADPTKGGARKAVMLRPSNGDRRAVILEGGIKIHFGTDNIRRYWREIVSPPNS